MHAWHLPCVGHPPDHPQHADTGHLWGGWLLAVAQRDAKLIPDSRDTGWSAGRGTQPHCTRVSTLHSSPWQYQPWCRKGVFVYMHQRFAALGLLPCRAGPAKCKQGIHPIQTTIQPCSDCMLDAEPGRWLNICSVSEKAFTLSTCFHCCVHLLAGTHS